MKEITKPGRKRSVDNTLTMKERKGLKAIVSGKIEVNSHRAQRILERPHVKKAFDKILTEKSLSLEKLAYQLSNVINRKPTIGRNKSGQKTTNIAQLDANRLQGIKIALAAHGVMTDKVGKVDAPLGQIPDKDLDKFIKQNLDFLDGGGKSSMKGANGI